MDNKIHSRRASALIVAIVASILGMLFSTIAILNPADFQVSPYNKTAGELREAREAMWRGMTALKKLENDLVTKAESYDEIKQRLEVLEQTQKLSKEELKSTLDAIGYTQSWFDWRNVLLGFFLGIFSSIVATLIVGAIPLHSKKAPQSSEE